MEQTPKYIRLRGISGENAGKWLWTIKLAGKNGIPFRGALPFEDAARHPEKYLVEPMFIEEEVSAWKALSLEEAMRYQGILKGAGIETHLA